MATATLEKETEVVADKGRAQASVADAAKSESRDEVTGSGFTGEARAWNARAQVD
jgi:hypothetical protein